MTRSISRRLLLPGATAMAVLTLGLFSGSASASAATAPVSTLASGPRAAADLTAHSYAFYMDNTLTEYLARVEGLSSNQVTLVRGAGRTQPLTDWINRGGRKNFTVVLRDWNDNPINSYNFASAQPIRYDGESITFQFERLIVS
ncbi:hypothetical protein [Streptomyces sp. NPDC001401]|uniref:hypothetical protein n=1 Tax=Streptomyces sp. NPDC001401 TaxID=3364570 RepID=UPI0036AEDA45